MVEPPPRVEAESVRPEQSTGRVYAAPALYARFALMIESRTLGDRKAFPVPSHLDTSCRCIGRARGGSSACQV